MPFDTKKFYTGVNIGWLNDAYGRDFSTDFCKQQPTEPVDFYDFSKIIYAYFKHLNARRIDVVRMWLLEGLEGLLTSNLSTPFYHPKDFFSYVQWNEFDKRIKEVMNAASRYEIQIYWTLLDAADLLIPSPGKNNKCRRKRREMTRRLLITDEYHIHNDIILPFLKSIESHEANVFAIDLINEVDWCWKADGGMLLRKDLVPVLKGIYDFIKRQNNSLLVTTSFAHFTELIKKEKSGFKIYSDFNFLDFFDYHRYYDSSSKDINNGNLIDWRNITGTNNKACIIGEAGHQYNPNSNVTKVDQLVQSNDSRTLMKQASTGGYSGILLWRYSPEEKKHGLLHFPSPHPYGLKDFLIQFKGAAGKGADGDPTPFKIFENRIWDDISI